MMNGRKRWSSMMVAAAFWFLAPHAFAECTDNRYVVPGSEAGGTGTITDPWVTLPHAVTQVRGLLNDPKTQNICVFLRAGTYRLSSKIVLTEADSKVSKTVSYLAYPGEVPVVSGGQEISGWQQDGDRYKATLSSQQVTDLCDALPSSEARCFRQLYVNGDRATRARWPDLGAVTQPPGGLDPDPRSFSRLTAWVEGTPGMIAVSGVPSLPSPEKPEIVVQMYWAANIVRVASAGDCPGDPTLTCLTPEGHEENVLFHQGWLWPPKTPLRPFHLEGAKALLNAPGEWYVERPGEASPSLPSVFYKLRGDEPLSAGSVVAPRLETLIEINGGALCPSFPEFCPHDITISGLVFEHTSWLGPNRYGYLEHPYSTQWWGPSEHGRTPAAIYVEDANNIRLERNLFRQLGATGIDVRRNVSNVDVVGNVLQDISAAGITVGTMYEDHLENTPIPFGIRVANNSVSYTGQDYRGGVGIIVANARDVVVEHNEVSHIPYTGINLGWGLQSSWPYAGNVVRNNEIHNVLQLLVDGGGIYVQGPGPLTGPYTLIKENYIHDIARSRMSEPTEGCTAGVTNSPTVGIYLDQGAQRIEAVGNVALDVESCTGPCLNDRDACKCLNNPPHPDSCDGKRDEYVGAVWNHCCKDLELNEIQDNEAPHGAVKAAAGLEAAYQTIAPASTPGSFVTRFSLGTIRNDHEGGVGFRLLVGNRDLIVRKIGRFRVPGNRGSHQLTITPVGQASPVCTKTLNTLGAPVDALGFQYALLDVPCRLLANQQYRVMSAEEQGKDYWYDNDNRLRTESDAAILGGSYSSESQSFDQNDPDRGYGPVNIVYDGLKLFESVGTEGGIREDSGTQGGKLDVGAKDLYVWRLGRYFVEGNQGSHALRVYSADESLLREASVGMASGDAVDELGFKWVTLGGAPGTVTAPLRLRRNSSYFLGSQEQSSADKWLDWDTEITPAGVLSEATPAYLTGGGWIDLDVPSQSYGPLNALYEPLERMVPCAGNPPPCVTVGPPRTDGTSLVGLRITVPPRRMLTVTELGRYRHANNSGTRTLRVYSAPAGGLGTLLAQATLTIPATAADDGFDYVSLPQPVVLAPGQYFVASDEVVGQVYGDWNSWIQLGTGVTQGVAAYFNGSQWVIASPPTTAPHSYGPLNLIYYSKSF